ncbi:hypothetical protein [Xylella taiwanensis]|nr:hypothetical protein [Xylella taiwanensis]MCD8468109.1 hypothetical protein [Xylella taiwanensis]UFN03691.1 hypothetical protein LPH41_07210 [Xylella taiwanensis]
MAGQPKRRRYTKGCSRIVSVLGRDACGDLFGHVRSFYAKQPQDTQVKAFQEHLTADQARIDLMDQVITPCAAVCNAARDADVAAIGHAATLPRGLQALGASGVALCHLCAAATPAAWRRLAVAHIISGANG